MKIRRDYLKKLLEVESISGKENLVSPIIIEELNRLDFEVTIDALGNIFAVRGEADKYPLLNAHMDIVDISYSNYGYSYLYTNYIDPKYQNTIFGYDDKDWEEISELETILEQMQLEDIQQYMTCDDCKAKDCKVKEYLKMPCELFDIKFSCYGKLREVAKDWGVDLSVKKEEVVEEKKEEETYIIYESKGRIYGTGKERVLGGDDKCGIFITLEIARLLRRMPMKIMFSVSEEEGCVGISHAVKNSRDWFNDIAYSLTIDRRGGDNLLWSQCGKRSCSNEFAGRLAMAGVKAGIPVKLMDGGVADVIHIREIVKESVNISAGYYDPHGEDEYVVIDDVIKITKWVRNFLLNEKVGM